MVRAELEQSKSNLSASHLEKDQLSERLSLAIQRAENAEKLTLLRNEELSLLRSQGYDKDTRITQYQFEITSLRRQLHEAEVVWVTRPIRGRNSFSVPG